VAPVAAFDAIPQYTPALDAEIDAAAAALAVLGAARDDGAANAEARDAAARALVARHWPRLGALEPTLFPPDGLVVRSVAAAESSGTLALRSDGSLVGTVTARWVDESGRGGFGAAGVFALVSSGTVLLLLSGLTGLPLVAMPALAQPWVALLAVGAAACGAGCLVWAALPARALRHRVRGDSATAGELFAAITGLAVSWAASGVPARLALLSPLGALVSELGALPLTPPLEPS